MPFDPKAVDGRVETARFAGITFERFRDMAQDLNLTDNEKIGMPDATRSGYENAILEDIRSKLPVLERPGRTLVDIGSGCGTLARRLIDWCATMQHTLVLVDSDEMLRQLPPAPHALRVAGRFPDVAGRIEALVGDGADAVLIYGVLSVVFLEANPFLFVDRAAALLRPGGRLLIGDVPNVSKLRRFLASSAGAQYHRAYMRTADDPHVGAFEAAGDRIDDGVVLGILSRARAGGYDAYVLPQSDSAPLSNRREDILIIRP